jgi:hypothetical protein
MRRTRRSFILFVAAFMVFAIFSRQANAQATIGGACSVTGGLDVDPTSSPDYLMVCNGSTYALGLSITTGGKVGIGTTTANSGTALDLGSNTNSMLLPSGTSAQRPTPTAGMIRYNSTVPQVEAYYSGAWNALAGSGGSSTITLGTSASATNPQRTSEAGTGFYSATDQTVAVAANGIEAMLWNTVTSGVDYFTVTPGLSGTAPQIAVAGTTNPQNLNLAPQGNTGVLQFKGQTVLWQYTSDFNLTLGATAFATTYTGGSGNGQYDTAVGYQALNANTTGYQNTALGYYALKLNTTGSQNTALGVQALQTLTTGFSNTALGYEALSADTTGAKNTALGEQAGQILTTGTNNVEIGYGVGSSTLTTGTNNILIGTSSSVDAASSSTSYELNIGNLVYGNMTGSGSPVGVAIGSSTVTTGAALDLSSNNNAMILPSGNTAQRPSATPGMLRYNSDTPAVEAYFNGSWQQLASGGSTSTIVLGTSASVTNPQRSGDATTGMFSPATGTVAVASAGTEQMRVTSGKVGIGTTTPQAMLHVNGEAMIGSTSLTCSGTTAGALRYSSSAIQFCNGTSWTTITGGSCNAAATTFSFTNQNSLATSTLTTSNIIPIYGTDPSCNSTVSVSGTGSPQFQVCADSACATVVQAWTSTNTAIAMNGRFMEIRATSPTSANTTNTITASVGGTTSGWQLSTSQTGPCGSSPTIGQTCSDNSIYAGISPDTNSNMYVMPCDLGQTWSGSACTGTRTTYCWNNCSTSYVTTSVTSLTTGRLNTSNLNALSGNTDGPYAAATACYNQTFGSESWYLPADNELKVIWTNLSNGIVQNNFSLGQYWSSTESSNANALSQNFNTGVFSGSTKSFSTLYVRCARRDN